MGQDSGALPPGNYARTVKTLNSWAELAGWFSDMTDDGLQHELEMLTREYNQAGRAEKKLIGEQLEVLKAEIARRGQGGSLRPLPSALAG